MLTLMVLLAAAAAEGAECECQAAKDIYQPEYRTELLGYIRNLRASSPGQEGLSAKVTAHHNIYRQIYTASWYLHEHVISNISEEPGRLT